MPSPATARSAGRPKSSGSKPSPSSQKWRCQRCDVTISYMPGHERKGPPAGWDTNKGVHCLRCRRAEAADAAIERAPADTTREERAKIRATAVLEFEILRDPDRPNGEIAKVVRCSVPAVLKSRRRLEAAGKPSSRR
ncbi:MAG: hypothetical protein ACJ75R_05745 [Solirubrobacterales bacterium]